MFAVQHGDSRPQMAGRSRACPLQACDRTLLVEYPDERAELLIFAGFGGLAAPTEAAEGAALRYRLSLGANGHYRVGSPSGMEPAAEGHLLFTLDKHVIIGLQHERPDLFFLHAAAVGRHGRVAVLAAPPGGGKSTLTLGLLQHGFSYLSDELAPIDLHRRLVYPYPHALCLKSPPPPPCLMPPEAVVVPGRLHVPVNALRTTVHRDPLPVCAFFFLRRDPGAATCQRVSEGTAVAHLLANALNARSHAADGLEAAATLAGAIPAFELNNDDLPRAMRAIAAALDALP